MTIFREIVVQLVVFVFFRNEVTQAVGKKRDFAEMKTDILAVLTKMYYFGQTEKVVWACISNFNNAIRIKSISEKWCYTVANYAITLMSGGFAPLALYYFDIANTTAVQSRSRTSNSIFKSRYAYYFLFYNQPLRSIEMLEDATNHFRSIGEMWELMTAVGALAQNYFLIANFEKSEKAYLECERVARKLNSPMHIGWTYNKVPFIRYLQGRFSASEAISMLTEGIAMSESLYDHMTLCIHYGHLAFIAEKENDVHSAIRYAKLIMRENRLYTVNIPHVKISYVNAVEALVFALESGRPDIDQKGVLRLAEKALKYALEQGKAFYLIAGPAYRASARLYLFKKNGAQACTLCMEALVNLKNSPYEWEYANAMLLASRCFPAEADSYIARAEVLFKKSGVTRR